MGVLTHYSVGWGDGGCPKAARPSVANCKPQPGWWKIEAFLSPRALANIALGDRLHAQRSMVIWAQINTIRTKYLCLLTPLLISICWHTKKAFEAWADDQVLHNRAWTWGYFLWFPFLHPFLCSYQQTNYLLSLRFNVYIQWGAVTEKAFLDN